MNSVKNFWPIYKGPPQIICFGCLSKKINRFTCIMRSNRKWSDSSSTNYFQWIIEFLTKLILVLSIESFWQFPAFFDKINSFSSKPLFKTDSVRAVYVLYMAPFAVQQLLQNHFFHGRVGYAQFGHVLHGRRNFVNAWSSLLQCPWFYIHKRDFNMWLILNV